MGSTGPPLDALIVGAGFSGLLSLYKLRQAGFRVHVYEAGSDLGGTWYWNRYPGARVDADNAVYQFPIEAVWKGTEWTERFPSDTELRQHFRYADQQLGLSKDITFNTRVSAATFSDTRQEWFVETESGTSIWARKLILCTGYASKRHTPSFEGLASFSGKTYHSSFWPQSGVDLSGKRVAVIGTGASGVQIIQTIAPTVAHLTVYQRTPNTALPMRQCPRENEYKWKDPSMSQAEIFKFARTTFGGVNRMGPGVNALDVTDEERRAFYEELYEGGGLGFWVANYKDVYGSREANNTVYSYWAERTRARVMDPIKRDLLAPIVPIHPFGAKRVSLETNYYEAFNQANVDLINVRETPILGITPGGLKTALGEVPVDVIVFATGFDSVTGGILNIKIENGTGETLQDKWRNGVGTYLGLGTAGFPNLFFIFGPQAPTAFAIGPTCADVQSDWITKLFLSLRERGAGTVEVTKEAEAGWTKNVLDIWEASTLYSETDSHYQGSNIPGKPREVLSYFGGIPSYITALESCAENDYDGFASR